MTPKSLFTLFIFGLCLFRPAVADDTALLVENAWIAEAPPVSKVMVAYMMLKNTGTDDIKIIRAESASYSSIEFHETIHENGMARMIRYDSLNIPANGSFELKPGGPHLMLFNPVERLKAGDFVNIKLTTVNNISQIFSVPVRKAQY